MLQHKYPPNRTSGTQIDGKWMWKPAKWKKCQCGMWHSNRKIPPQFWKQPWEKKINKVVAGVLMVNRNILGETFILIVQSYGELYGLPKGCVEMGETCKQAAHRELEEETGIKLDLENSYEINKYYGSSRKYSFFVTYVDCNVDTRFIPLNDVEITSVGFVKLENIKFLKLNRISSDIIENFKTNILGLK